MDKRLIIASFFVLTFMIFGVGAQEVDPIVKAYRCLDAKVNSSSSINLQEAIFSALAHVPSNKTRDRINAEKSSGENCWPSSGCDIKTTAQVVLAKKQMNQNNVTNITTWLKSKSGVATGLNWYLQITIDDNEADSCIVGYGNTEFTVVIDSEMKLSGNLGSCLSVDESGYKLRISNTCLEESYSVKCTKGFRTNLLYKKGDDTGTLYVSPSTQKGQPDSSRYLIETINAKCFKNGGACDYEATLWATTALYNSGDSDYALYVPYLRALVDENGRYFPEAFLKFIIPGDDDLYNTIIGDIDRDLQNRGYWQRDSPASRFYDTSLGMLALGGCQRRNNAEVCSNSVLSDVSEYLLEEQGEDGCWNSGDISTTAFLLYAGWQRNGEVYVPTTTTSSVNDSTTPPIIIPGTTINSTNGSTYNPATPTSCEAAGYYCARRDSCLIGGGTVRIGDNCVSFTEVCCTIDVSEDEESCSELNGLVCKADEECSGSFAQSSDGACCLGNCNLVDEEEEEEPDSPPRNDNEDEESGTSFWWIVLGILIILVVVGIIYRNKLRTFIFNMGKSKKSGGEERGAVSPPIYRRPPPNFGPPAIGSNRPAVQPPRNYPVPVRRASTARGGDKEMDDTLKKLKSISEGK